MVRLDPIDALAQLSFLVQGALGAHAADHDLSTAQARLLGVLRDRTPTMNELARMLELDKSSVTGLVDRAERRQLVQRTRSSTDGRVVEVRLTRSGRTLATRVAAGFAGDMTALLARLPRADRAALTGLVSRLLVAHAEAHGVDLFAVDRPRP